MLLRGACYGVEFVVVDGVLKGCVEEIARLLVV